MLNFKLFSQKFWQGHAVPLSVEEKLMFMFLLINYRVNIVGIYPITMKRISVETGLKETAVYKILDRLMALKLILFDFKTEEVAVLVQQDFFPLTSWQQRSRAKKELELVNSRWLVEKMYPKGIRVGKNETAEGVVVNIPFSQFWEAYNKKVGKKEKVEAIWNRLTDEERIAIMENIPKYHKSRPDKQYWRYPESYLNNRTWEDEIIYCKPKITEDKPMQKLSKDSLIDLKRKLYDG